jgi:hypothetical protein
VIKYVLYFVFSGCYVNIYNYQFSSVRMMKLCILLYIIYIKFRD